MNFLRILLFSTATVMAGFSAFGCGMDAEGLGHRSAVVDADFLGAPTTGMAAEIDAPNGEEGEDIAFIARDESGAVFDEPCTEEELALVCAETAPPAPPSTTQMVTELADPNLQARGPIATSAQITIDALKALNAAYDKFDATPNEVAKRLPVLKDDILPAQQALLKAVRDMKALEGFDIKPSTLDLLKAQLKRKQRYEDVEVKLSAIIATNQAIIQKPPTKELK